MFSTFVLVLASVLPPTPQAEKREIPDPAAQKETLKLIREIFKSEYSKKTPADRQALAAKLLQQAVDSKDDPTSQYVLLDEARVLAAEGGDGASAIRAIDELFARFLVNRSSLKLSALSTAGLTVKSPDQAARHADSLLKLADEALAAQDFEVADKAATSAATFSRAAKSIPLISLADAKIKELSTLKSLVATFKRARESLQSNPDDPAANLIVGRFLCLSLGSWPEGLPYLAKGSDPVLKGLAERELSTPKETAATVALADAWWDAGEKETGKPRDLLRSRACFWYEQALPSLTGLTRVKVEKRLTEGPARARGRPIDLLRLIDPQKDAVKGTWERAGATVISPPDDCLLEIPYAAPAEYDLTLRVERKGATGNLLAVLAFPSSKMAVTIDQEDTVDLVGMGMIDGRRTIDNETAQRMKLLGRGKQATIVYSMRKTGVALKVDGRTIFDWKGDLNRLSVRPIQSGTNPDTILIAAGHHFIFSAIELTPISDPGSPLR